MNIFTKGAAVAAVAIAAFAGSANAAPITFDDFKGRSLETFYAASHGVKIETNASVWGGNGNGDPGNWNLEGTNGSAFLGCNQGNNCSTTFSLAAPQNGFAFDIGIANNWAATFTVKGYLNSVLVDTAALSIANQSVGVSPNGTWKTASLAGNLDEVVVTSAFSKGFAFGIDNVNAEAGPSAAVPVPAALPLLGAGIAALGLVARKRKPA
jgi:hypothetical protein